MKFAYKVCVHFVYLWLYSFISKMRSLFQFSNLMGTIYRKGNVIFTNDGNSVISPVGNKLTIYDLKKYVL